MPTIRRQIQRIFDFRVATPTLPCLFDCFLNMVPEQKIPVFVRALTWVLEKGGESFPQESLDKRPDELNYQPKSDTIL